MAVRPESYRFTIDDYYRMGEAGIFAEDDRVELLLGQIISMNPIGSRHAGIVNRLSALFFEGSRGRYLVSTQNPIRLSEVSEPQPDLALLKLRHDYYAGGHPGPGDVFLVVEISETSSASDRDIKIPLYGSSGIKEVWLVDLAAGGLTVFRNPSPAGYSEVGHHRPGNFVAPSAFPDIKIGLGEFLTP
ncbi:MAG: Uma2 family endonuclease [Actinomycetota bacterium]